MSELEKILQGIVNESIVKMIISKPAEKSNLYKKIVIERKREYFRTHFIVYKFYINDLFILCRLLSLVCTFILY